MERKERAGNALKRMKRDYVFRAFVFSALSFLVTVVFTGYNVFLWIVYRAVWNIGIAVYYALLSGIRAYVIFSERKYHRAQFGEEEKENKRKKLVFVQSIFLLVIDFALIAPISLMVLQKKPIAFSSIPAIATAAYTTCKIVIAARNIVKIRKKRHLSLKILRTVSFVDALVSVLTLQYTLIITFGGGMDKDMFVLCAFSSFGIWVVLIGLSLKSLVRSIKLRQENCR